MAEGKRCTATIMQFGAPQRCDKERGHEKRKAQAEAIHDSSGVTWYDGDLEQFDTND